MSISEVDEEPATPVDDVGAAEGPAGPAGPGAPPPGASAGDGYRPSVVAGIIRELAVACITAGVVLFLFVGYQLFGTSIAEANSQNQLKQQFEHLVAPAAEPSPTEPSPTVTAPSTSTAVTATTAATIPPPTVAAPSPPSGTAVAHLVIPKIKVDKFIVEDVTVEQLRKGPGHYPQTPMPGDKGNAAIAGHRTTYGAPFYRLNELQPGDDIYVTTKQGKFHYIVFKSEVVQPTEVSVLDPTPDSRLTLTTCNPRFSAATRLVVVSRLVNPPAPAVVAPPVVAPAAPTKGEASAGVILGPEQPLSLGTGDKGAWPPTLLYGALTLLLWIGARVWGAMSGQGRHWAGQRHWLPFVVGIPVCLVPLWFVFENVMRLLPANV